MMKPTKDFYYSTRQIDRILTITTSVLICGILALFGVSCSEDIPYGEDEEPNIEDWEYRTITDSIGKRYGVRWKTNDPYDLGERCLDAEGLRARFGVGSIPGKSDYDQVYPWSEIKRCNIKRQGEETIITFDDDPSFSVDGSNGVHYQCVNMAKVGL